MPTTMIILAASLAIHPAPRLQPVNEIPNSRGCVEGPHDPSRARRMVGQAATTASPAAHHAWDAYYHCPGSAVGRSDREGE